MIAPSARGDGRSDRVRVDVERVRGDVDEHGGRTHTGDAASSGEERVGAGDDFVAGADAERHQRGEDGIGAG